MCVFTSTLMTDQCQYSSGYFQQAIPEGTCVQTRWNNSSVNTATGNDEVHVLSIWSAVWQNNQPSGWTGLWHM